MNQSEIPLRDIEDRTFKFAVRIIKLCQFLEGKSWVNSTLGRQLLRCGTSIGSNVEEAQAAQSRPDFISKNNISVKEARETHYRLRLLAAAGVIPRSRLQPLLDESLELKRILGAIVISARKKSK
ncbi:MAG TPA: four helix bundle protein [Candidatus Sulfotelmatobacter sp.]|nr:four helix bundle protein [Candidatus Sulfotelmatobacter sp.]